MDKSAKSQNKLKIQNTYKTKCKTNSKTKEEKSVKNNMKNNKTVMFYPHNKYYRA